MKKNFKQFSQFLGTQAVVLVAVSVCAAQGAPAEKAEVPPAEPQKSVFQDDSKNGKDPFFPNSVRRNPKAVAAVAVVVPSVAQLALKGISGPVTRRFALINNQPFAAGESAIVRTVTGQVKVHCWEIRENSVIVSVEGDPERKELRLNEGL